MSEHIRYEAKEGIGTITIDRPEKRNAMTYGVLEAFHAALRTASEDDTARVLILTGAGGAFCAGTDLSDLQSRPSGERSSRDSAAEALAWPLVRCPRKFRRFGHCSSPPAASASTSWCGGGVSRARHQIPHEGRLHAGASPSVHP